MDDLTGVVLAGGRSKRMGMDKATLRIQGETLFQRQLDAFREVFSRVLIAGDRPDLASPEVPCVPDLYPGSALGGLYTGLSAAGTPNIFAAPCDMPFPDTDMIRFIVSHRTSAYDAVVPRTSAGMEPLFAVYSRKCLPVMKSLLEEGNYRILDIYERVNVLFIEEGSLPPGWERALLNINTRENLEHIMLDIELETRHDGTSSD